MSVKVYKDGAWTDIVPLIYKNGAWAEATSVKVYENGAWVEKLVNYNNMVVTVPDEGFAANSENYIICVANNITAQLALSATKRTSVVFSFTPSGADFGYYPVLKFDLYMKSNGMMDSTNYAMYALKLSYGGKEGSTSTGGYLEYNRNLSEYSTTISRAIDVGSESKVMSTMSMDIYIPTVTGFTGTASVYVEIKNLTINGIPYGVNTIIKP